jgi:dihydroorotate dehydrogenase (fumarate)
MDLSTDYMGLALRSPLVASAGPLTGRTDSLRALQDAGIAAVVLPSLFEEQVVHDELSTSALFDLGSGAGPEATSYFPDLSGFETIADRMLRHVEESKRVLHVPVIASLNGTTPGGWARYARLLQDAGADALELNLYRVVAEQDATSALVEAQQRQLVCLVRQELRIPLAVKVSPYYSAFAHFAAELATAGADALVLFNRFYQPDLSPVTRQVVPSLELSTPHELRLPLRWIALLHGRVATQLAATTGIWSGLDAAKALLAGADVTMMTSALLRHGPEHVRAVEAQLVEWGRELGYASLTQLRGSASQRHTADPSAFERANYIDALVNYADSFHSAQGTGPW